LTTAKLTAISLMPSTSLISNSLIADANTAPYQAL
jgi:hypothetical protein